MSVDYLSCLHSYSIGSARDVLFTMMILFVLSTFTVDIYLTAEQNEDEIAILIVFTAMSMYYPWIHKNQLQCSWMSLSRTRPLKRNIRFPDWKYLCQLLGTQLNCCSFHKL
ncbi:hypothetical protein NP493_5279g00002 [Ridgeia piscesae]|uniref:Uncharacterized protein n=1 Tax=Ridgeia piscesae TaxID=27915 RepID=A0AAD9IV90_RIDPI|nr:hypothetical protein NP493_5279g00002 [Ridgeia piscesae]